jgi:hypothetical protein
MMNKNLLDLVILFGGKYKLLGPLLFNFLNPLATSFVLGYIFASASFLIMYITRTILGKCLHAFLRQYHFGVCSAWPSPE